MVLPVVGVVGCGGGVAWAVPGAARAEGPACSTVLVRLICEDWLPQGPCSSLGSQSRSGRGPALFGWVAHNRIAACGAT